MRFRNNKGITLAALIITIIVLIILASITVYGGDKLIKKAKIENLKTDMLLIQAESKSAIENVNFKKYSLDKNAADYNEKLNNIKSENLLGEILTEDLKVKMKSVLQKTDSSIENIDEALNDCYYLKLEDLNNIDIKTKAQNGDYIIRYNLDELTAEVYYINGFNYNEKTYYSISQLNEIKE